MLDCGQYCSVSAADSSVNRHHTLNHLMREATCSSLPLCAKCSTIPHVLSIRSLIYHLTINNYSVITHPLAILSWLLSLSDSLVEMVALETMRLFWRADSPSSVLASLPFLPRPLVSCRHTNTRIPIKEQTEHKKRTIVLSMPWRQTEGVEV